MDVALIVLLAGAALCVFIAGLVWLRNREFGLSGDIEQTLQEVPLTMRGDAVLVSREHGQLIYANAPARAWMGLNGGDPHLERIARIAQPVDSFLELFAGERQSSFQLGQRWVEASSHRIPTGTETRTVIVMRELSAGSSNPDALDLSVAMTIINQIGETVNASLGVEQTLQTLLSIIKQHVVFDAGEINLKDEQSQLLLPRGWIGEATYLVSLAEFGGAYAIDEGVTGWIARHQKPVLYDRRGQTDVLLQPKVPNIPYPNILGVPLMQGNRFIGTLELASRLPGRFKQPDLALIQAISKPVSVAIYNASLYADQVRRIEDITNLQKAVEERSAVGEDTAPVYATLNQRIAQLMDADMCGVFLYDETRRGLVPALPFHGMPDALARAIFIPMPPDSPQRDIWERQSEWISNTVGDEPLAEALGLKAIIGVAGIRNTAWLPMQISSERIGVLAVSNKRSEGFTPRDTLALKALASQAAIVVANLRLFQRERRLDAELEGLQEITYAIGALSHEGEFYQEITERIARLMEIAMCGILLYDESEKRLVSRLPFYGLSDDAIREYSIPITPNSVMEQLWEEEDFWYTNNVATNALTFAAGLDGIASELGVQKTLVAVLSSGGRRIGVVQASNKLNGQDFNDNDARLLLIFATQAASIIENARLFREVQRSSEQAQKLRRIAELAGTVATNDAGIVDLLHEIQGVMESPIVFISVLDQTGSLITYPRWMLGAELSEPVVQDAYSPNFEHSVVMSRRPFMSNHLADDKRLLPSYRQVVTRFNLNKTILVPLLVGEKSLGELGICNRATPYTEDDLAVLSTIASQISSALDRLLIYEAAGQNLNRRLEELDAISRVSNELTLTLDFDQILNVIRKESLRATGASGCTVALLVPQERWHQPDQPEMERRLGNARVMSQLADVELEAISRGADSVIVNDYQTYDLKGSPPEARSAVAATIMYVDQVVGVLHLYHEDPNRFDDRAAAFLMTLSTKASLGYGNAIRFQEQVERSERLRRRVEQLNRIFELGHMLHTNSDLQNIVEAVAYSIQQSVGFDSVVVLLADDEAGVLRRYTHAGLPMSAFESTRNNTISVKRLNSLLKEKYRISESYFFPVEEQNDWSVDETNALSTAFEGNRTIDYVGPQTWRDGDMLLVMLNGANGKLLGLMSLDRPHNNRRPDRGTVEVLEIFTHQAATTMENSRLYQESVRNAEQESRLNEVMEAVSATLDVTKIVEAVAQRTLRLLPFNRIAVSLVDADQNGFSVVRANVRSGNTVEMTTDNRISLERTALGRSYLDRQEHIYHADDNEAQYYDDLNSWRNSGEKAGIVLPLLTGGQCLGSMHIGSDTLNLGVFNEFVPLLKRMSQLVAASIQNARLFDQAVNLRVLNESVIESIQQGIVVLDNSGRVISVNQFMRQRYGWEDRARGMDIFAYRPEVGEAIKAELRDVLQTGIPQESLNQTTHEGDAILVRNFYLYPLRSDNAVRGAVMLVEDVTDRAVLEQAMESRANQLAALTEVSTRITSSLEREEVVNLALSEMEYLLKFETMTLWRRNGSNMVLEGIAGATEEEQQEITRHKEYRIRINDHERVRQVVDTQRVVLLNSEDVFPEPLVGETQARTWLGVPLVNQGHVVGMVILTRSTSNAFNNVSDQNIAFAFASQVAIALANADLFEQTFDRTNELGTLFEAAQATSLTQDLDSVFRTVVELMFSALDMDECLIMIWDEVDNELEVQIDVNRHGNNERIQPVGTRYRLSKYPAKLHALREREVIVVLHDDQEVPYPSELEELRVNNDAARMLVPLVVREQSIGLIQLEQHTIDNRQMTQQKIRLARALGAQVAVAIENARLSNQMSQMFSEALIINDLSQAISSSLNVQDMIKVVRDRVPAVTGSDELYLALYDEKTQDITFPLAVKAGVEFEIPGRKLNDDEVSFVIKHRRLLSLGADYFSPDDLRKSLGISNGEGDVKSYMGVPLTAGDKVFGVLALRDNTRTRAFTINDQRILTTVGSQLGAAIQNAQLFQQISSFADDLNKLVEERTRELEEERDRIDTLYQITSELARTLDMDRLLKRALGMVAKAVGAEDGVIMALDPLSDSLFSQAALNPAMLYEDEEGRMTHPAEKLGAWLMNSGEQVITIDDLLQFEHWDATVKGAEGWRSGLAVVLESNENDPQGVMVMLSNKLKAFGEPQLRLMVAAANQVASAINNADLYHLIRDQAERLGTLLRAEQEEAEKNSAILESIADGVILSDAQGRIILFNSAAERILQLPREQVLGQPLSKFTGLYGGSVASWAETIQSRMDSTDVDRIGEYVDERLPLGDRIVSAHLSPVFTGDKFLGMVSVFRDITRDVEVDRMKGEFVASVSHELRTPLTPIKGYTDLLLMGATGEINDAQKKVLATIKENVDRLTVLVEDVLDISKIDTGKERLKIERIDIYEMVNTVLAALKSRPNHQRKAFDISVNVAEEVPAIQGDRDKLNRVMSNLIDNAFNYTPSGGSIDISARLQPDGRRVLVAVKDTGVGIPEHFREDVWRRFQRYEEHALKLEVPGTGLGLAIVKEMVEMHNGDVWFESEVDKGTTFYLTLPIDQTDYFNSSTRATSTGILRQVTEE